jgi:hypothetical protein
VRNVVVTLVFGAIIAGMCCVPAFADGTTTCSVVGQSMLSFSSGVNAAVVAATKATLAASSLPGTTAKRNPGFKVVEDESAKVEASVAPTLSGLGPLVDADFGDPTLQNATDAVTVEGRAELQEALSFGRLSLHLEQAVDTRSAAARRLAIANALRAFGSSFATSNTYGTVNGQPFSATTVTRAPNGSQPIRIPPDATLGETADALAQEQARLLLLPYTFNPLVNRWIAACRTAHQLPPAPTATP